MSWDVVHDSRRTFLACMRAQCAPGTPVGPIPVPGLAPDAALDTAAAVLLSLLDPGLTLAVVGNDAAASVARELVRLIGAEQAAVGDADFVLVAGDPEASIEAARRGSPLHPEDGATLVVVGGGSAADVSIRGPGIQTTTTASLPLSRRALDALATANAEPPRGIDLLLVTGLGRLLALPRTSVLRTEAA